MALLLIVAYLEWKFWLLHHQVVNTQSRYLLILLACDRIPEREKRFTKPLFKQDETQISFSNSFFCGKRLKLYIVVLWMKSVRDTRRPSIFGTNSDTVTIDKSESILF